MGATASAWFKLAVQGDFPAATCSAIALAAALARLVLHVPRPPPPLRPPKTKVPSSPALPTCPSVCSADGLSAEVLVGPTPAISKLCNCSKLSQIDDITSVLQY